MEVRRCNTSDAPEIARIIVDFLAYSPYAGIADISEDAIQAILADTRSPIAFFIAEESGKTLGACAVVVFPLWFSDGALMTQELFWWVEPHARTTRCGKAMLSAMEEWSTSVGAKGHFMVCLENEQAERMKKVYNTAGYKAVEHTFFKREG